MSIICIFLKNAKRKTLKFVFNNIILYRVYRIYHEKKLLKLCANCELSVKGF